MNISAKNVFQAIVVIVVIFGVVLAGVFTIGFVGAYASTRTPCLAAAYGTSVDNSLDATSRSEQYKSGLLKCNKEILNSPTDYNLYYARSIIKMNLGNDTGALEDINKYIELNPEDADGFWFRAILKKGLNDSNGEHADRTKACAIGYDQDSCRAVLGGG